MKPKAEELAAAFASHMQREEDLLGSLQLVVHEMRKSLLSRDDQMDGLILRHAQVSLSMERMSEERNELRRALAKTFAVPEQSATVALLIKHCDPPTRNVLEGFQQRLRSAAESLNGAVAANGNLALQMLDLLESVFQSLSGDRGNSIVYECSGRRRVA